MEAVPSTCKLAHSRVAEPKSYLLSVPGIIDTLEDIKDELLDELK